MNYPDFSQEEKLHKKGFKYVCGLDEAGRGPLAGPVVAAAAVILDFKKLKIKNINDSKKVSKNQRENLYKILIDHPQIKWGIGIVSEKVIDKINILQATKLAMQKSVKNLDCDFLLLDGNFKIDSNVPQKSIIKGDQKVISISIASIIAKVTRDKIMEKYDKQYPNYGFAKHKGYGTKMHFLNLEKSGPCKIHRKSFYPVNKY